MGEYLWRRLTRNQDTGQITYEMTSTDTPDPPTAEEGWQRLYHFGVGKVKGAGDSPARAS